MFNRLIFSERFLACRKMLAMSQTDLANYLGVGKSAISMIEGGKRAPSIEVLCAVSALFHVSTDYLCGLSDDPTRR